MQISNYVYCDDLFENLEIQNKLLPNPYYDYPYLIIKDFFSQDICHKIVQSLQSNTTSKKANVKITDSRGFIHQSTKEQYRKTNIYKLKNEFYSLCENRFLQIQPKIEEFFKVPLTLSTKVQVLEYQKGFFYTQHADDSSSIFDENKNTIGFKNVALNRKLTTVLFGTTCDQSKNDNYHFSGGELVFNYLKDQNNQTIKFTPSAGDMIVFPSNPIFSHEVLKVLHGYRLTLVQWHDAIL